MRQIWIFLGLLLTGCTLAATPASTRDPTTPTRSVSGSLAITIYGVFDPAPANDFSKPHPGFRAVGIDLQAENLGASDQKYDSVYAAMKDVSNRSYSTTLFISTLGPILFGGINAPGEATRGWCLFEVPEGVAVAQFIYSDTAGHRIVIDLAHVPHPVYRPGG